MNEFGDYTGIKRAFTEHRSAVPKLSDMPPDFQEAYLRRVRELESERMVVVDIARITATPNGNRSQNADIR